MGNGHGIWRWDLGMHNTAWMRDTEYGQPDNYDAMNSSRRTSVAVSLNGHVYTAICLLTRGAHPSK